MTSLSVATHAGRTDKANCHNDKKAGTRHCH
ncbi:YHYH domain-containing protein [Pseudomonas sp. NPDC089734]